MRCPHPVTLGSAMRVTWREQFSQFLFNHQCLLKTSLASVAQENNVSIKPNLSEGKFVITARSVHIQDVAEEVTCMWRRHFHASPRHLCYTAPAERWNKVLSPQFFFFLRLIITSCLVQVSFPWMLLEQLFSNWTATVGESLHLGFLLTVHCYRRAWTASIGAG